TPDTTDSGAVAGIRSVSVPPAQNAEAQAFDQNRNTLLNNNATKEQRLGAAEKLFDAGHDKFSVQGKNGVQNFRIEREDVVGKKSLLHVYASGDSAAKDSG